MKRLSCYFVVFVLCTITSLPVIAQDEKKLPPDAKAYIQASIKTAQWDIAKYQGKIESLEKLAKNRRLRRKKRVSKARVLKDIKIYQGNIDSLKVSLPEPFILNEYKLKIDDVGQLVADYDLKVIQVIDGNSMFVGVQEKVKKKGGGVSFASPAKFAKQFQSQISKFGKKTQYTIKQVFWLEGISTKGIVDNQNLANTPGIYRVVGSITYETLTGTNTVLKVKKLNMKSIQPHIDKWLADHKKQ